MIIQSGASARTRDNNPDLDETRGHKGILVGADVREIDHIMQDGGLEMNVKGMHWISITWDLSLDIHWRTLQATMREALEYGKHKALLKQYLSPRTREARNKWAHDMYVKHPEPRHWHRVRFKNEFHAGYGPVGQLWIIRKLGDSMRYRDNNI